MSKQTEAQRLATILGLLAPFPDECAQAAAELLRQEALIAELSAVLKSVDEAIYVDDYGKLRLRASFDDLVIRGVLAKVKQ